MASINSRRATRFLSVAAVIGLLGTPESASAANFFEQLFGVAPSAPPAPTYSYDAPLPDQMPAAEVRRPRKLVDDSKPVLQKTTDLMHDKTLRPGDAVMMKSGIEIYSGGEGSRHSPSQFVPLDDAHVTKATRKVLVAMDDAHRDPLGYVASANVVKEGRSSASDIPVATGYRITDARGQSVRYVGP